MSMVLKIYVFKNKINLVEFEKYKFLQSDVS